MVVQNPFAALVLGSETPLCTGTLVAPLAVLTAASCVTGGRASEPKFVFVGLLNAYLDPFRWGMADLCHRMQG